MHTEGFVRPVSEIEVLGKLAERSMRQHMIPPRIVLRGGHVIGHDVEEDSELMEARALHKTGPGGFAAEVFADPRGIRDVVSMRTAGNCLQAGREVHMADAQIGQVRQYLLRLRQGESRMQLQAIAGDPLIAHGSARPRSARRDSPTDCVLPPPSPRAAWGAPYRTPPSIRTGRVREKCETTPVRDRR